METNDVSGRSGPGITPEVAERILAKDYTNIVKKVTEGKPLSKAERDLIRARAEPVADSSITTAKDLTELASILGVSRQTVHAWRKLEGAPPPAANGSHSVIAWRQFIRHRDLHVGKLTVERHEALKARKLLAEVEQREIRTAILKGEYVALEQVRLEWTTQVGKAIALMRAKFESELPPILSGLDAIAIQRECAAAIDEVCETLHSGGNTQDET
jgi:DNA-binding transcriptional MerR regulator